MRELFPKEYTLQVGVVSLVVNVTSDVNSPGSFDPRDDSDWDYFGYRETDWDVIAGTIYTGGGECSLTRTEIDDIIKHHHRKITRGVQWLIDKESSL